MEETQEPQQLGTSDTHCGLRQVSRVWYRGTLWRLPEFRSRNWHLYNAKIILAVSPVISGQKDWSALIVDVAIFFLIALCRGEEKTCRNQKHILFILRKTKKTHGHNKEAKTAITWDGGSRTGHCSATYKLLATLKSVCATPKLFCRFPSCCAVQLINPGQTPFPSTQSLTQAASCCS